MLSLIEDACEDGMDVTFDSYPYAFSSTRLLILLPQWTHNSGPEHLKEILRSPAMREQLRQEITPRSSSWQDMWLTYFQRPEHHKALPTHTL